MAKVFASLVAAAAAAQCSSDDQSKIQAMDDQTFGDKSNKCGKQALGLTGINHDKFNSCMATEVAISSDCSECYATTADYGFKNCKAACLLGWCKQGCLDCTAPAQTTLPDCTGIPAGSPTPCLQSTAVKCSSDDQSKIQAMDDQTFGDKSNKCGKQALGLTGINHDKFNSCMATEVAISSDCSECYAVTADYGFKNCKAACLLGWCKQGCLDCTAPAQTTLPDCTGIPAGSPTPCLQSTGGCSSDDQTALADPQNVGEKQDACGKKALSLTGINHDKFTSCVQSDLGISASCSECYYATATYGFKNCKAACLLGWCKQGCLDCTKPAQDDLATCAGFATAVAQPCLESTGGCSSDDQTALADPQNVGEKQDACGKKALSLTGINHDKFTSCVQSDLGISASCSECYYATATYGFKNCKAACLLGWCKQGCLDCTKPAQDDLATCAGFATAVAQPCLESTGGCSSDDQTALADPQNVGEKQDACGKKALTLTGISHDKFTSCVQSDLGISASCSECYYATATYGFKNCKAACLLGWCKQGCLDCTKPAQDDLATCAGFSTAVATPCMDTFLA